MPSFVRGALGRVVGQPVRVDVLTAAVLLLAVELQVSLDAHVPGRLPAGLAGAAVCVGVAARRRFTFAALLAISLAMVVQVALGGRLTQHAPGALLALALIFYAAGAFLSEQRGRAALLLGLGSVAAG